MRKPQAECADYPNAVGGGMRSPSALLIQKFETSNILSQSIVNLLLALRTFVDTLFSL